MTRRESLALFAAAGLKAAAAKPVIESHLHLFDPAAFPYHPQASYKPEPLTLAQYVAFAKQIPELKHVVIVHPEPYQDDHRYLLHCFEQEPSKGFFKGTCLFDAMKPDTPQRMAALMKQAPGRIVAVRVHATEKKISPSGPIRDRDLTSPEMARLWKAANDLGTGIQMHMIPMYAPQVRKLAAQHKGMPVIIDHLSRAGQGTPAEYDEVLRLAELPDVYMKLSGVRYSSKQDESFTDTKPLIRKTVVAFGPRRMVWGGIGKTVAEYQAATRTFEALLDFLSDSDRDQIRYETAKRLYRFS